MLSLCSALFFLFSIHWGLSGVVGQTASNPDPAEVWISYRILPSAKKETVDLLTSVTVPDSVLAKKGDNLEQILKLHYGYVKPELIDSVKLHNPAIREEPLQEDALLSLPAHPHGQVDVSKEIKDRTTLYEEAQMEIGYQDENTLKQSIANLLAANPSLKAKDSLDPITIPSGTVIHFPFTTRYGYYRLRPEFVGQAEDIKSRLKQDPATSFVELGSFKIISPIATVSPLPEAVDEALPGWPFGSFTDNEYPLSAFRRSNQVVVSVIDTGLALDDPDVINRFHLWSNVGEANQEDDVDDDGNGKKDDVNGCSVFDSTAKPRDNSDNGHGTHVAGIATGRMLSTNLRNKADETIELMVIKVTHPGSQNIPAGVLGDAVHYARKKSANIINISLEGPPSDTLKDAIEDSSNQVFVIAAGNGDTSGKGLDLAGDDVQVYPAKYGKSQPNIITVAAHDRNNALIPRSNFSNLYVDIAAPGDRIKSTVPAGKADELSGTSQAAPLVTLTAALIFVQGLREPNAIKQRILFASDYVPGWNSYVSSEGRLNIAKAVTVYDDVIQLNNNHLKIGKICDPKVIILKGMVDGVPVITDRKLSVIRRMLFGYKTSDGKSSIRLYFQNKTLLTDHLYTQTGELKTVKIKTVSGQVEEISITDIADIVTRSIWLSGPDGCSEVTP